MLTLRLFIPIITTVGDNYGDKRNNVSRPLGGTRALLYIIRKKDKSYTISVRRIFRVYVFVVSYKRPYRHGFVQRYI